MVDMEKARENGLSYCRQTALRNFFEKKFLKLFKKLIQKTAHLRGFHAWGLGTCPQRGLGQSPIKLLVDNLRARENGLFCVMI